ncbi:MAG: penicillin-binding protein 2 [Phycisphaeraceae bacterium]|nr:MAG: penicillin-binding protein 2 [Phycisphaeraceae bacterium]
MPAEGPVDGVAERNTPEPQAPPRARADRAVIVSRLFAGLATLVFAVVVARVAQLKIGPSDDLSRYLSDRVGREREPSPRGDLLDRRGRPLSMSEVGYRVVIDPVAAEASMDRVIMSLAETLGVPTEQIGVPLVRAVESNEKIRAEQDQTTTERAPSGARAFIANLVHAIKGDDGAAGDASNEVPVAIKPARPLKRYLPIGPVLERPVATVVEDLGLPGVAVEEQLVRKYPGGDEVASILGKVGYGHEGLLGAERTLNDRLRGEDGRIGFVHDAKNRPVMIDVDASKAGERGEDVRLSLDLELQRIAIEELDRGMEDADAAGGRLVMMRPQTGEILAMVDRYRDVPGLAPFPWVEPGTPKDKWLTLPPEDKRPRYVTLPADPNRETHPAMGRNRCVEDTYEPGSTFKSFVWASAWELGVIGEGEVIDTRPYTTSFGRHFQDVTKRDHETWQEVLINSSNVGMVKLSERLTHDQLRHVVEKFGFGMPTRIGLPGESAGLITSADDWTVYSQTSVVIGHEVAVTPVQMVRAFGAYARQDGLAGTLPHLRLTAPSRETLESEPLIRVLRPDIALMTRGVLVHVAEHMDQNMRRLYPDEPRPSYAMFGKSGTADIPVVAPVVRDENGKPLLDDRGRVVRKGKPKGAGGYYANQYNSSFIAGAPVDDPQIVVIVVIDDPGPARVRQRQHYGSAVAGPVVRRVMERSLRYLGVPPIEAVAAGG